MENKNQLQPLIVILGPTASGKTGLALALAKRFSGELVNADSRQIYRGLDIGTNKLAPGMTKRVIEGEEVYRIDGIPIHLIDITSPDRSLSLFEYKAAALAKIRDIQNRGKLPILVGGTGLYVSALVDNLDIPRAPADVALRQELEKQDAASLHAALERIDPEAASNIGAENKRKLIRALEVYKSTGRTFSSQRKQGPPLFSVLELGLQMERAELYARIDARVGQMIASGLVAETQQLLERYSPDLPALSGIGYREMGACLRGEITQEEAAQRIKFHTHQYARRQLTWFKRDNRIHWVADQAEAERLVQNFIQS